MSEPKLLPEQEAYNDGIEAAKRVIRGEKFQESDTADYIIPCLLTAIARKTNPYAYTRTHSPAQAEWCHWVFDDDDDSTMWETSCGNAFQFFDGGPSDNKAKFCQYCGKPIEESRTSDFNEDAQQND